VENMASSQKSRLSHAHSVEEIGERADKDFKGIVEEFKRKYRI
jgi:hypothetical protein